MQRDEQTRRGEPAVDLPGTAAGRAVASILAGATSARADDPAQASAKAAGRGATVPGASGIAPGAGAEIAALLTAAQSGAPRTRRVSLRDRVVVAVANRVVATMLGARLRHAYYRRALGWRIGRGAVIQPGLEIHGRSGRVVIGDGVTFEAGCLLVGVGACDLAVGDGATIAHRATLVLGGHRADSSDAEPLFAPLVIESGVCIGPNATIVGGIVLGEGSVVAAGAVVTTSVPPYAIVAGNPAAVVGERPRELRPAPEQGWLFH